MRLPTGAVAIAGLLWLALQSTLLSASIRRMIMGCRLMEVDVGPGLGTRERLLKWAFEQVDDWNRVDPSLNAEVLSNPNLGSNKVFVLSRHESLAAAERQWDEYHRPELKAERMARCKKEDEEAGGPAMLGCRRTFYRSVRMD